MTVTLVVGGQLGGEGKGKVTANLCREHHYDLAIRCGGPNSGHTFTIDGKQRVLRQVSVGVVDEKTKLGLAAGCIIDLDVLFDEIRSFDLTPDKLIVDRNAVIINEQCVQLERDSCLRPRIGSTCTGVGGAVSNRVLRNGNVKLAKDIPELKKFIGDLSEIANNYCLNGKKIIVEGTQGFGLSLYHSPYYPFATSRDTTASSFLSEVGLSPLKVSDIIMVIRTFPIRVGGNSGPLPNEICWDDIKKESGYPHEIKELTTVTQTLRRVARFDINLVKKASLVNSPTKIAVMGLDYLDYSNYRVKKYEDLTLNAKYFISHVERETKACVAYVGTGPLDHEILKL